MKDLVSYSLDINILVQSDVSEKKLFYLTILAIDYYRPLQSPILTELIFLQPDRLNSLVGLLNNPNRTKSQSHNDNCNMGKEGNKMFWTEKIPSTNPNYTKSKSQDDIYSKNHYDISDGAGIQQLLSDNSKGSIKNFDIGKVDDEVTWIEEMPPTDLNYIESKNHGDNYNSNCNSNRIGSKEQKSDNLEGSDQFGNIKYNQKVFHHT